MWCSLMWSGGTLTSRELIIFKKLLKNCIFPLRASCVEGPVHCCHRNVNALVSCCFRNLIHFLHWCFKSCASCLVESQVFLSTSIKTIILQILRAAWWERLKHPWAPIHHCACVSLQLVSVAGGCVMRSPASVFVLRRRCVLRAMCVRVRRSVITRCWAAKAATVHQLESIKETRASAMSPPASAREICTLFSLKAHFLVCNRCWCTEELCVT